MKLVRPYLRELYVASFDGWDRFWFTPSDPATLSLIRIFTGAMLVYTHAVWSIGLTSFFGPHGLLPAEAVRGLYYRNPFCWSYLFGIESPTGLWTAHLLALAILVMFTLGLATRITSILAFLITVAYTHRAGGALFGLDQINGMLACYLAVGPSGAMYSLDHWFGAKRAGAGAIADSTVRPSVTATIAIRLIQVHMCIIYLFAGCGKLLGPTWWDGTALWGALANYEYQTFDLTWLAAWPEVVNFLTHLTIVWEVGYIALVWPRWTRPLVIGLAIPIHLGIGLFMGMTTFGLIMLVGNCAFVSPVVVREIVGRIRGGVRRGAGVSTPNPPDHHADFASRSSRSKARHTML